MKKYIITFVFLLTSVLSYGQTVSDFHKIFTFTSISQINNFLKSKGYKFQGKTETANLFNGEELYFGKNCTYDISTGEISYRGNNWYSIVVGKNQNNSVVEVYVQTRNSPYWNSLINSAKKNGYKFTSERAYDDNISTYYNKGLFSLTVSEDTDGSYSLMMLDTSKVDFGN